MSDKRYIVSILNVFEFENRLRKSETRLVEFESVPEYENQTAAFDFIAVCNFRSPVHHPFPHVCTHLYRNHGKRSYSLVRSPSSTDQLTTMD